MSWPTLFSSSSPASSWNGRRAAVVTITALCGIGCIAYMLLLRRSHGKRRKKKSRKAKWNDLSQLESNVILQLQKTKMSNAKEFGNKLASQQQAMEDLLVLVDQLESLLSSINELEGMKIEQEYIWAVKEKLDHLNEVIESVSGKTRRKAIKEAKEDKLEDKEDGLTIKRSEKAMIVQDFKAGNSMDDEDDDDDDSKSTSSDDSFVSASGSIPEEISEEDTMCDEEVRALMLQFGHLGLYRQGIEEYNSNRINVRKLRTEMLSCLNDADFKVKVYCIRNAFKTLLQQDHWRNWFLETGHGMLRDFLKVAGKNCFEFERDFKILTEYCQNQRNWKEIEEELKSRGVCCSSFFDIVLDFVIMDSFDDLANPPYALTSVIQNGWITNSIKEAALSAAVWSLMTAKIRMLQNPNAFMVKFYQLSQHITPTLVWGFLGPDGKLKDASISLKGLLLGFLQDIFSLDRCNYSSIKELADDVIANANERLKQTEIS